MVGSCKSLPRERHSEKLSWHSFSVLSFYGPKLMPKISDSKDPYDKIVDVEEINTFLLGVMLDN